jgi:hypothetical protein
VQRSFVELALTAFVALFALAPAVVAAQDAEDPAALVEQGIDLRERGDDVGARALIQRSFELAPTPRTTAQLGLVEQALGLWIEAERHLSDALTHSDDAWIRRSRAVLEQSLTTVRGNIGTLEVLTNVPGATVTIGGAVIGTTPLAAPIHVVAGRVEIEVTLDGYRPREITLTVAPGAPARQLVELSPMPASVAHVEPPPPVAADPVVAPEEPALSSRPSTVPGGPTFVWSWVGLGATVAAGAVTIGLGVAAQGAYDGLRTSCSPTCSDDQIASSGVDGLATGTNVMIAVTGVFAVATVVLFVVEGTASRPPAAEVAIGPGRIELAGRF